MKFKTVTIDISTLQGLRRAERMHAKGYRFQMFGVDKLRFWVPVKAK